MQIKDFLFCLNFFNHNKCKSFILIFNTNTINIILQLILFVLNIDYKFDYKFDYKYTIYTKLLY